MSHDQFIQLGVRLHYLDFAGGEPPILLLPGWTANAHAFDGLVQNGLSPRYRSIAIDPRGRGMSDSLTAGYSVQDHAGDVIALMDALGFESTVVLGHSYGGFLAMYLGAFHPKRIRGVIVMEAASTIHPRNRELLEKAIPVQDNPIASWETYLENIKKAPHFAGWWDPTIEEYYRAGVEDKPDGSVQSRTRSHVLAESLTKLAELDWCATLSQISQPLLLLHALGPYGVPGTPPIVTTEMANATVACAPNARAAVIPGNHLTMLYGENAPVVVEKIVRFVSDMPDTY